MRKIWVSLVVILAGCGSCDDDTAANSNNNGTTPTNNSTNTTNNSTNNSTTNNGEDAGNSTGMDAGMDADTRDNYCLGSGPPILNAGTANELCTGEIAAVSFRFAMCTCEGLLLANKVTTSSIDSLGGAAGQSASIGTNEGFQAANVIDIGGSLWAGGSAGVRVSNDSSVSGDLRSAGQVSTQNLTVGRNLDLMGNLTVIGDATVGGELHQPASGTQTIVGTLTATQNRSPVTVNEPCDCAADQMIPITDLVTAMATSNDNAEADFDADALKQAAGAVTLDVPCGRLYLSGINGAASVTLNINGRVALFVAGNIRLSGDLTINVPEGSELDLFIGGNLGVASNVVIGNPDRPAATRIYVGGSDAVTIASSATISGNLYAPKAELILASNNILRGSVFARKVTAAGMLEIIYDQAILRAGDECDDTTPSGDPKTCDSCRDCGNQACTDGTCSDSCTSNDQCCSGLSCIQGQCGVIL